MISGEHPSQWDFPKGSMTFKLIVDQTSPSHTRVTVYSGHGSTLAHSGNLTFNKDEWNSYEKLLRVGAETLYEDVKLIINEV